MHADLDGGFLLIDPTGTLARQLADTIPQPLRERVCYLDIADVAHPVGFNVLNGVLPDDRHKLAEDICAYFEAVFPEGPATLSRARTSYILLNCLRVLLDTPGSTFLGIPRLLTDTAYRTRLLDSEKGHCHDPKVLSFWNDEFARWDEKARAQAIADFQAKMGRLLTSPVIRNIIGQPFSTFSLDAGHIIIADLDRSKLGDQTAYLLGSLLIARSSGTLYINDLGFFARDHLARTLRQERATVALNTLSELPAALQQAALAIPDKTVFTTTMEDAERLAFYVGIPNPVVLVDLRPWEARTPAGLIRPVAPQSTGSLEAIRRRSRACFTRPREIVVSAIANQLDSKFGRA